VTGLPLGDSRKLRKDERLTERSKLSRAYRKAVKEQRDELRALYPELSKFDAIDIAPSYRPILLNYLSAHLAGLRERAGRPTFDDPLPDQPDDLFIRIRRLLAGF
jgi:hypothetical protein